MNDSNLTVGRFFRIVGSGQAYLNLIYLLAAFPLGIFYFTFLVSGLSLGISLSIIWVGIPLLLLMGAGWWGLASFERYLAIHILKEDLPEMKSPSSEGADLWTRFKEYCCNPVTWKGLLFLFLKFPLGMLTFVIMVTVISLTLAFLSMPFTFSQGVSVSLGAWFSGWSIDSMQDALLAVLIGLLLWPVSLHITNGLAWVHAKFARVMLSVDPGGIFSSATEVEL
jgi:hypothetical protein